MDINENTKIAKVLKHNPQALDALVAVTPKFEKLRNPLLRKLMAGRTSLRDAAKIGGCDVTEIAAALKPLGFVFSQQEGSSDGNKSPDAVPDFFKRLDQFTVKTLDVRRQLAEGEDILKLIMAEIKVLPADHVLQLINTFEPTPLINLLKNKGYEHVVKLVSTDEVHTFFKQKNTQAPSPTLSDEVPETATLDEFTAKRNDYGDKVKAVDVSQMEMPMPMVTILESLEQLAPGHILAVQHKRIPVFLFNELKERNCAYLIYRGGDTDVRLLIWKNDTTS